MAIRGLGETDYQVIVKALYNLARDCNNSLATYTDMTNLNATVTLPNLGILVNRIKNANLEEFGHLPDLPES